MNTRPRLPPPFHRRTIMASEIVATNKSGAFRISAETVSDLRMWLQDGIKAHAELQRVTKNIHDAAAADWPARHLAGAALAPRPVDMDVYQAVEMLSLLDVLEEI